MPKTHVMVDLETLGTTADAVILSIGAVRFDIDAQDIDNAFYIVVSIDSQPDRRISGDTLAWWVDQSREAQAVFRGPSCSLKDALITFNTWLGDARDTHMWSNGADFDLPMILHAMAQLGIEPTWKYYNHRCFRTFKNLPFVPVIEVSREGAPHHALHDAHHQARVLQEIRLVINKVIAKVNT